MDSQTGKLRKTTPIERTCNICKINFIDDEKHFLFVCNKYDEERQILFEYCMKSMPNFANESENNKLICLMYNEWTMFAVELFVHELWQKRKILNMYNKYFNLTFTYYYKIYVFIVTYKSYKGWMHLHCMLYNFVKSVWLWYPVTHPIYWHSTWIGARINTAPCPIDSYLYNIELPIVWCKIWRNKSWHFTGYEIHTYIH